MTSRLSDSTALVATARFVHRPISFLAMHCASRLEWLFKQVDTSRLPPHLSSPFSLVPISRAEKWLLSLHSYSLPAAVQSQALQIGSPLLGIPGDIQILPSSWKTSSISALGNLHQLFFHIDHSYPIPNFNQRFYIECNC